RMDIEEVLASIDRYRITNMFGTPTFYRMILEHPSIDKYDLSSLMWCYSGGDYLPPAFIARWMAKTGKYIYQGLGATEACGGITMTPGDEEIPEGSLGRVLSIWTAKLVDPDTMEEAKIPGQGELLISSDHMIKGYWNKPEDTAKSFITVEGRLWYRTGDIVRIDEKGWVYFVDRSGDIIKHKGYRVVPSKIEKTLTEHPAIAAACVIGIPDEEVGEKIKGLVIAKAGIKKPEVEELIDWCRNRLAPYEVPHWIEYRDSLPTSPSGKILRRKVRQEEREKAKSSEHVPSHVHVKN
ncbi:MAG: acyl--CoA ligase, partial [Desulfobacterota bacterium]|nr:acyl--CoA ligase [Thermodesulfobacteriota bacterium]